MVLLGLVLLPAWPALLVGQTARAVFCHSQQACPPLSRGWPGAVHMNAHAEGKEEEEEIDAAAAVAAGQAARSGETLSAVREHQQSSIAALKAAMEKDGDDHPVAKVLSKAGSLTVGSKLRRALKKPKGTLAILGEGALVDKATLGGYDLNDPVYLSAQFREGSAAAVCVGVGCDRELEPDALAKTIEEQALQAGQFPGPLPVLARGDFIEALQLAEAAAAGAAGVMLNMVLNGAEPTVALASEAEALGLETILRVGSEEELSAALDSGAKMVCVGDCSLPQAAELRAKIPQEVISICDIYVRDVRGAWKVRDMGFNALIVSDAVLDVCVRDRVPPTAVLKAMLSKGSVQFGLGMQKGRLEGAKESLGTLAM